MRIRRKLTPAQRKGPTIAPAMNEGRWRSGIGHARFPQRGADFNHQLAPVVVEVAGEAWDERGVVRAVHLGVPLLDSLERFGEARRGGDEASVLGKRGGRDEA